ncbi:nicotianamine synthase family protein [Tepidibacter thalassicus]|uniref:Nicotianamine synthase protein n=1 Tax=Tepidibacter thalassicus DSM 15285 TaxID=1123350 RepID=A0A1M5QQX6_9FIRM|nr:nicotianamine synthase family protein [Tepidibacter thalassicus]SHH16497.1 Nicotianamine synthase protein [Tepidibacter thalassicus DSM 15285]
MKDKYKLLLSLKLLEYEIKELINYSKDCYECFDFLSDKLDYLCEFMNCEENLKRWNLWKDDYQIKYYCEKLRETASNALCYIEKYQSSCIDNDELNRSNYIMMLSDSVRYEFKNLGINNKSKVIFVGSGAFPVSAITIAKEIGAQVMCVDIDNEAISLAKNVTESLKLDSIIKFSSKSLRELDFVKVATHIIVASLVKNKKEVLADLKENINTNAKIILRYGNGLKSIFNYPFEKNLSKDWIQIKIDEDKNIYDTIILERSYYECG